MGIGVAFTGFSQVFLYEEGFENGLKGWTINNGNFGLWQYGVPAVSLINTAANGNFSIVTNLTGEYNNREDGNVTSPSIDYNCYW